VWQVVLEALHLFVSEVVGVELFYMTEKSMYSGRSCTLVRSWSCTGLGRGLYTRKELQYSRDGAVP
jgi:hypothetical protein